MTKSEDKVRSKKALAMLLSSLEGFERPKVRKGKQKYYIFKQVNEH